MVIIGASNGDLAASPASVMKYVFRVFDPLVLKCAIKLDILDVIYQAPRPVTLAELAASLPVQCADLSKLCRLLHYLACMDVVVLCCDGVAESYALTPSAKFLVKGEGTTLAFFLLLIHDENFLSAVHGLDAVLIGETPAISTYKKVKSETLYGHLAGNPELSQLFNQAMIGKGLIGITRAMEACPELFLGIESLVDVGGGVGVMAHEIVKKFPCIHCTVPDLQHVIECSSEYPEITYLAGDMFEHIPKSDAVLLMINNIKKFQQVKSETLYGHLAGNPELSQLFNQAMIGKGLIGITRAMEACPELFLGIESLVDVGGGVGVMAHEIVKKFPCIHCTVLDLQHVIECSSEYPEITYLAGDMFEHIPKSDAVLLMSILTSWSDEESLKILKRCKEALTKKKGKLIIIDVMLEREEDKEKADAEEVELRKARLAVDMLLLAICEGRARTEKGYRELLLKAGFNVCKITDTKTLQHVIEAYPC